MTRKVNCNKICKCVGCKIVSCKFCRFSLFEEELLHWYCKLDSQIVNLKNDGCSWGKLVNEEDV